MPGSIFAIISIPFRIRTRRLFLKKYISKNRYRENLSKSDSKIFFQKALYYSEKICYNMIKSQYI